jgi:hypothetical protein
MLYEPLTCSKAFKLQRKLLQNAQEVLESSVHSSATHIIIRDASNTPNRGKSVPLIVMTEGRPLLDRGKKACRAQQKSQVMRLVRSHQYSEPSCHPCRVPLEISVSTLLYMQSVLAWWEMSSLCLQYEAASCSAQPCLTPFRGMISTHAAVFHCLLLCRVVIARVCAFPASERLSRA